MPMQKILKRITLTLLVESENDVRQAASQEQNDLFNDQWE